MRTFERQVARVGRPLATVSDWIPFPRFLRRALQVPVEKAGQLHPAGGFVAAAAMGFAAVEVVLFLARQPLYFFWSFFGWISGNDVGRLSAYNLLAHTLAFVVAFKVIAESRPFR